MSLYRDGNMNETPHKVDILIVGNGALALFLADELAQRETQKRIAVVGPAGRDGCASRAAGAMLPAFSELSTETLSTDIGKAKFELALEAHKLWDGSLDRLQRQSPGGDPLKVSDDTFVVLNSKGSDLDSQNFDAMIVALKEYQAPWEEVEPKAIAGFNPQPDCRAFRAIRLPDESGIDVRAVLSALEASLADANIPIIDQYVRKVQCEGDVVSGVELSDGSFVEAEWIVIAAGARSEALVQSASKDIDILPTFPGLGLGMVAKRYEGDAFQSVVRTPNRAFGCGLHVVPNNQGREYIGATNSASPRSNTGVRLLDLHYITKYAMQQLDEGIAYHQVEQFLRGFRPISLDGYPMIGALPMRGLYVMTGTFRDGVHSAPLLAVHVANELEGKPRSYHLEFTPTRKPIVTRTIESSIDECVIHSLANWYEYGENAALFSTKEIEAHYRDKITKMYDEIDVDYALPPEVLWYAFDDPENRIVNYLKQH